jgi:membrane protein DedA with SNARE-associated domain
MDPLSSLVDWVAAYGMFGLFAVGFAERIIPALPSYGLLVAVGMATAGGELSVLIAMVAMTSGSFTGGFALYLGVFALNGSASFRFLYRVGRLLGLSSKRVDGMISSFRSRERSLLVMFQLVPTVRLVAPLIAGVTRTNPRRFITGTLVGIVLWNGMFIVTGHAAALIAPETNASALAIKVLMLMITSEIILALAWRAARNSQWRIARRARQW